MLDAVVREIKNAGGRMVMLVVKHHDGFCLWPSRYTEYDVTSSPSISYYMINMINMIEQRRSASRKGFMLMIS